MTTLRTAAQQALEALENARGNINQERAYADELEAEIDEAITALHAALEQPEPCDIAEDGVCETLECCKKQGPVAWQWLNTAHFRKKLPADAEPGAWNPLYTHPPRREWRGLTDEAVIELLHSCDWRGMHLAVLVRAIEQALKEKNQ